MANLTVSDVKLGHSVDIVLKVDSDLRAEPGSFESLSADCGPLVATLAALGSSFAEFELLA